MERNESQTWSVSHVMVTDLHVKIQVNIYKRLEKKKILKTVWSLKFTKSKARNIAKDRWSVTKLKFDL